MKARMHAIEQKVRYAETDAMGIVYYANYLVWFEVGRTEYLLAEGLDYREVEKEGFFMAVVEALCVYKAPARYGDSIIIETRPSHVRNSSMRFEYRVVRKADQRLLCEGTTTHVLVDAGMKPKKIPEKIRRLLSQE